MAEYFCSSLVRTEAYSPQGLEKLFEKRKWCVSNETPTFSRVMYWQYLKVMGCSDGSLKTGKPSKGMADCAPPSLLPLSKQSRAHSTGGDCCL